MITVLHRGGGVFGTPKSNYVICARPSYMYAYVPYCLIIHQFTLGLVSKHLSYCPPHLADHAKPIGCCHFVVLYAN